MYAEAGKHQLEEEVRPRGKMQGKDTAGKTLQTLVERSMTEMKERIQSIQETTEKRKLGGKDNRTRQ